MKVFTEAGSVWACLEEVRIKANKNSFQEKIIQKTAVAAIPFLVRGRIILKKASSLEHPSTMAASSNWTGISAKKLLVIHITKDRLKTI